jgi:peptidyl-prolyl cis-trans isomerase SurA
MRLLGFIFLAIIQLAQPASAQGLFDPVIIVNDQIITKYELDQRRRLMDALGVRGDLAQQAKDGLIGDRLKVASAAEAGLVTTDEQISKAFEDFAARNGQSLDGVLSMLAGKGVATETLRDFLTTNLVWQTLMRQRYAGSVGVSESEIDAALSATSENTNLQILISEIVLPFIEGQEEEIRKLAADIAKIRSFDEFSDAARQFSVAGSRSDGGKLDWIALSNLPPALRPVLLPLENGQVSEPLELPNAIAIFQMRGLNESAPTSARYSSVEYALLSVADTEGVTAELVDIADRAIRCDDLYGLSQNLNNATLSIMSRPPSDIPNSDALWLARLDAGESLIETRITADGSAHKSLVMLCSRTSTANQSVSRDEVRTRIQNEKLNARANSLLESMKASARIIYP